MSTVFMDSVRLTNTYAAYIRALHARKIGCKRVYLGLSGDMLLGVYRIHAYSLRFQWTS